MRLKHSILKQNPMCFLCLLFVRAAEKLRFLKCVVLLNLLRYETTRYCACLNILSGHHRRIFKAHLNSSEDLFISPLQG